MMRALRALPLLAAVAAGQQSGPAPVFGGLLEAPPAKLPDEVLLRGVQNHLWPSNRQFLPGVNLCRFMVIVNVSGQVRKANIFSGSRNPMCDYADALVIKHRYAPTTVGGATAETVRQIDIDLSFRVNGDDGRSYTLTDIAAIYDRMYPPNGFVSGGMVFRDREGSVYIGRHSPLARSTDGSMTVYDPYKPEDFAVIKFPVKEFLEKIGVPFRQAAKDAATPYEFWQQIMRQADSYPAFKFAFYTSPRLLGEFLKEIEAPRAISEFRRP